MQVPGRGDRANNIVTALNDHGRNLADLIDVFEQVIVRREERAVHKIMTLDAGEAQRLVLAFPVVHQIFVRIELGRRAFPDAPCTRGREACLLVVTGQAFVIGGDKIAAFFLRDLVAITLPKIREYLGRPVLIEPRQFLLACKKYAAKYQSQAAIRMRFAVRKAQRRAPRAAECVPFLDPKLLTQRLDILDQIPSRILPQLRMRCGLARTALVKKDNVIRRRIKKLPVKRYQPAARPAMQKDDGNALRIADAFVIDRVNVRNSKHSAVERFDFGVKRCHKQIIREGAKKLTRKVIFRFSNCRWL